MICNYLFVVVEKKALVNNANTFKLHHSAPSFDPRIMDIVDNTVSSKHLAIRSRGTQNRYVPVVELIIKNKNSLCLRKDIEKEGSTPMSHGILYLKSSVLYVSEDDIVLLLVGGSDLYDTSQTVGRPFLYMCQRSRLRVGRRCLRYMTNRQSNLGTSIRHFDVHECPAPRCERLVAHGKVIVHENMHLFGYYPRDKKKR